MTLQGADPGIGLWRGRSEEGLDLGERHILEGVAAAHGLEYHVLTTPGLGTAAARTRLVQHAQEATRIECDVERPWER